MLSTSYFNKSSTLLHDLIRKSVTAKQLQTYLSSISVNEIKRMVITLDNKNKLPIDLLAKTGSVAKL